MHSKSRYPISILRPVTSACKLLAVTGVVTCTLATSGMAFAQKYPITPQQRRIAQSTAARGVPIRELAPNAPSRYVVKKGDTLWGISGIFLKRPWRWPELWGLNMKQIRDPHLIYPGQVLWLEIVNGRARLRTGRRISRGTNGTIRLEPRIRGEENEQAIPAVPAHLIEPFLSEPLIVDLETLNQAPWVVASKDGRNIVGTGDRIYVRSADGRTLQYQENNPEGNMYRIFRNAVPIKDPATKEILGYEGQFVGRAQLVRSETTSKSLDGGEAGVPEAAALDVIYSKEDIQTGDRLLPEPPSELLNHMPHAPDVPVNGLVASVYGNAVAYVGQNQIVTINKGTKDGITHGTVLALISTGRRIVDKTNLQQHRGMVKLPDERNGLLYVFRPFDRVSYGLVIEIKEPVKIGDRVENPMSPTEQEEAEAPAPTADAVSN